MSSKFFKKKKTSKSYVFKKTEVLSVNSQLERLKSSFPNLEIIESTKLRFEIILKLRPHIFSREYDAKINIGYIQLYKYSGLCRGLLHQSYH